MKVQQRLSSDEVICHFRSDFPEYYFDGDENYSYNQEPQYFGRKNHYAGYVEHIQQQSQKRSDPIRMNIKQEEGEYVSQMEMEFEYKTYALYSLIKQHSSPAVTSSKQFEELPQDADDSIADFEDFDLFEEGSFTSHAGGRNDHHTNYNEFILSEVVEESEVIEQREEEEECVFNMDQ